MNKSWYILKYNRDLCWCVFFAMCPFKNFQGKKKKIYIYIYSIYSCTLNIMGDFLKCFLLGVVLLGRITFGRQPARVECNSAHTPSHVNPTPPLKQNQKRQGNKERMKNNYTSIIRFCVARAHKHTHKMAEHAHKCSYSSLFFTTQHSCLTTLQPPCLGCGLEPGDSKDHSQSQHA